VQSDPSDAIATVQAAVGITLQLKRSGPQCAQCDGSAFAKLPLNGVATLLCDKW
jgi:hypothetical protein